MSYRLVVCVAVIASVTAVLFSQGQATFRGSADAVMVDAVVLDGRRPVTGLTREQFELRDNGVVQQLGEVTIDTSPIDVTVIVERHSKDRTISFSRGGWLVGPARLEDSFAAAERQVRAVLPVSDRVRLIVSDREVRGGDRQTAWYWRTQQATLDAITAAMMLGPSEAGRRHFIVALTNGVDTISGVPRRSQLAVARASDAVVSVRVGAAGDFGVVSRESGTSFRTTYAPAFSAALGEIAQITGGTLGRLSGDDLGRALRETLDAYRTRYVIRYTPTGVQREGWHELQVQVRGRKVEVRHRKGYEIVREDSAPAAARRGHSYFAEVWRALEAGNRERAQIIAGEKDEITKVVSFRN